MGYLTTRAVERILKNLVGYTSSSISPHIGLFTTSPTESSNGVEVSVTNTGYARKPVETTQWTYDANTYTVSNNISFSFSTASIDWGTIVAVGIFESSTGTNLLWYGKLGVPVTIRQGQSLIIDSGTITLEYSGSPLINDRFDLDFSSDYIFSTSSSNLTLESAYDSGIGFKEAGSLRMSLLKNTSTVSEEFSAERVAFVSVTPGQAYSVVASCQTSNTKLVPKLEVSLRTILTEPITDVRESVTSVQADKWQTRSLSFTADANTRFVRVRLVVSVTDPAQTGTVWLDNIRVIPTS